MHPEGRPYTFFYLVFRAMNKPPACIPAYSGNIGQIDRRKSATSAEARDADFKYFSNF
jgi:hypothetical protein